MRAGALPTNYLVLFAVITLGIATIMPIMQSALTDQGNAFGDVSEDILGEDPEVFSSPDGNNDGNRAGQNQLFDDEQTVSEAGSFSEIASQSTPIEVEQGESISREDSNFMFFDANSGLTTNVYFKSSADTATTEDIFSVSQCGAGSRTTSLRPLDELSSPSACDVGKPVNLQSGTVYVTVCSYSESSDSAKILLTGEITVQEAQEQCQQEASEPGGSSNGDSDQEGDGGSDTGDSDLVFTEERYTASPGQVQNKIDEASENGGGYVYLENIETYNPSETIVMKPGVVLDFNGAKMSPDGNQDLFLMAPGSLIRNAWITTGDSYTENVFAFDTAHSEWPDGVPRKYDYRDHTYIEDCWYQGAVGGADAETLIYLHQNGADQYIAFPKMECRSIGAGKFVEMHSEHPDGFIIGSTIHGNGYHPNRLLEMRGSGAIKANTLGVYYQAGETGGAHTEDVWKIQESASNAEANMVAGILWDAPSRSGGPLISAENGNDNWMMNVLSYLDHGGDHKVVEANGDAANNYAVSRTHGTLYSKGDTAWNHEESKSNHDFEDIGTKGYTGEIIGQRSSFWSKRSSAVQRASQKELKQGGMFPEPTLDDSQFMVEPGDDIQSVLDNAARATILDSQSYVRFKPGETYTISEPINVPDKLTIDFNGAEIVQQTDNDLFVSGDKVMFKRPDIDTTEVNGGFNSRVFNVDTAREGGALPSKDFTEVDECVYTGNQGEGTLFYLGAGFSDNVPFIGGHAFRCKEATGGENMIEFHTDKAGNEPVFLNGIQVFGDYSQFDRYIYAHGDESSYGHYFGINIPDASGSESLMDYQISAGGLGSLILRGELDRDNLGEYYTSNHWKTGTLDETGSRTVEQIGSQMQYFIGVKDRELFEKMGCELRTRITSGCEEEIEYSTSREEGDSGSSSSALKSVKGSSQFEEDVNIPQCDGSSSNVKIIDSGGDWGDINNDQYDVFCVKPVDYSDQGRIEISNSGDENNRKYLVYDGSSNAHPVDQSDRAIVEELWFNGASHWTVSGLSVYATGSSNAGSLSARAGSTSNIFNRMLVTGKHGGQIAETTLVDFEASNNVLQNSVVRKARTPGADDLCVGVKAPGQNEVVRDNKIVSNELYDCTDQVQLVIGNQHAGSTYPGTVIAHNDLYFTDQFRTDGNGNFDEDGDYHCGENAIDVKEAAGTVDADPVEVVGNRIWGGLKADEECGASGGGVGPHTPVIVHDGADGRTTKGINFRNNLVIETPRFAQFEGEDIKVENNLFYRHGQRGPWDSIAILGTSLDQTEIKGNTFTQITDQWGRYFDGTSASIENNVVIDGGTIWGSDGLQSSGNAYYGDSDTLESNPAVQESSASAANNKDFCVTLRAYTQPREKCFSNSLSTTNSPHGTDKGFYVESSGSSTTDQQGDFSASGSEGLIEPIEDYSQYDQKYVSTEGNYDAQGTQNDPWSVRAAEDKTQPGTVVNFLPGTYSTTVEPPSGTDGNPVIFRSSERHQAKMQRQEGNSLNFKMIGASHVTIQGFYINAGPGRWLLAWNSDHITIRDNFMEEAIMDYQGGTPVDIDEGSSYVNLVNNKMVTSKKGNMVEVSSSKYVKIVGNVVSMASHSPLQVEDNENIVIRANVLHNPIGRAGGISNGRNQLFENNIMTINFAGPGSGGSSTKVFGQNAISRYNRFFNFYGAIVNVAIFSDAFEATDSRYYHNTFHDAVDRGALEGQAYDNWGAMARTNQEQYGIMRNLEFENNIYHELGKGAGREYLELGETDESQHQFFNNFFGSTGADPKIDYLGRGTVQEKEQENPQMFSDNMVGDSPGFEDAASYDHKLADGSQLIDAGKQLTSAENSGPGTTLEVGDSLYFYDGFGIPGERGDLIQVGSERARVTEVNGNQLELSESIDWDQGDGVSMAYGGSAPDIGAHEKSGRPQIIIDKSSHMVSTGEQVQLTAKMVNLPQIEEVCWQFGDTEGKCGQQVTHSYDQPGGKGIRVRAVDSNGNTYWDSAFIKVDGQNNGFPGIDYNIRKTENFLCDGEDGIYTDAGETELVETEDGWVCE